MDTFNPSLTRSVIKFYDSINQYVCAMSGLLPTHGFEWIAVKTMNLEGWREFVFNQSKNSRKWILFEVDLDYPAKI